MNSWNWGTLYFFEQLSGFNIVICPNISLFEPLQNEQFEVRDPVLLYITYKQLNSAIEKNVALTSKSAQQFRILDPLQTEQFEVRDPVLL